MCLVTNHRSFYQVLLLYLSLSDACIVGGFLFAAKNTLISSINPASLIVGGFLFAAKNTSHHFQSNQSFPLLSRFSPSDCF
jgi:hypothetical protein